jgi:sulfoxide reductase heme-binding subunit YedZ
MPKGGTLLTPRRLKPLVFVLAAAPFAWLVFRAWTGRLSVNPIEDLTLTTGIWALRFLLITLAITPIRRLTGWHPVVQYRRMLGLFAFFYALVHLLIYVVLDQGLAFEFIFADIVKRPYITAGMVAFLLMVPLAVTSTRGMIRRLGRRWQTLHRLIYISAAAGCLHFIWKVKVVIGEPVYYAAILAVLLGFRALWWLRTATRVMPARVANKVVR